MKKVGIFFAIFLILFYFRVGVLGVLSTTTHFIFRPVLVLGNSIGNKIGNIGTYFESKKLLSLENETLKLEKSANEAKISNYNSVLNENVKLKETLERIPENKKMILGSILSKPNRSLYDTLIIDIGVKNGIYVGQKVFALGNIPIGKIAEIYESTSKVVLFSSPGEKTDVIVSGNNVVMQLNGRGGGNFEMILPRDFTIEKGALVVLPGITSQVVGIIETILSDPRDSYQKALLRSPINIFELQFIEIEK